MTNHSAKLLAAVGVLPDTGQVIVTIEGSRQAQLSKGAAKHLASLITEASEAAEGIANAYNRYQEAIAAAGAVYVEYVKPFGANASVGSTTQ